MSQRNVLNITAAQKELAWIPQVPMVDGLKKTALWMRDKLDESILQNASHDVL